jgi:hypothetical protein
MELETWVAMQLALEEFLYYVGLGPIAEHWLERLMKAATI